MSSRLEKLKALCDRDPKNPLGWYSLALEQKKTDPKLAVETFEKLRNDHPDYVATFYHYGKTLEEMGDKDNAKKIFQQGIQVAQKMKDGHAEGELKEALQAVG